MKTYWTWWDLVKNLSIYNYLQALKLKNGLSLFICIYFFAPTKKFSRQNCKGRPGKTAAGGKPPVLEPASSCNKNGGQIRSGEGRAKCLTAYLGYTESLL